METDLKKITKGILTIVMTFMLFTGLAFASTPLQDGEYTINVQAVHTSTGELSRADEAIKKPVKLEVENSKINVIMEMEIDMYDLAVQNRSGGFDLAKEVSENISARTITYKFPVSTIDEPVLVEAIVGVMGSKVNFKIAFDKGTLKNISTKSTPPADTPPAESTPAASTAPAENLAPATNSTSTENTSLTEGTPSTQATTEVENIALAEDTNTDVSNPETGDNIFSNLFRAFLIALFMSISVYGVHKNKARKTIVS